MSSVVAKRLFDVTLSVAGMVVLAPVFIAVALAIRAVLGSPVIFRQTRPGLGGRPFVMYKFRTMDEARDERGSALPDEDRLGRFGRFLRATSLDELPELWNVLAGDMSLVGPRPLLMSYLPLYSDRERRRHEVRPGITGWAQVHGRNQLSWERRFELDAWYVDHRSIWLDLRILWMTAARVARAEGISQAGHVSAKPFTGNRQ
jgi:lipopolysaccharide/colanic/teichoic acid biosynthesis glycosyltransferase